MANDTPIDSSIPSPVAIIGTACRFPGSASSPSKLWELLRSPRDLLKEVPRDRFYWEGFHRPDGLHGSSRTKEGYFIEENIRAFDPHFFGLLPSEVETIDPQHRILLENVYEAMESAGLTLEDVQGTTTGVFVGMMDRPYYENATLDGDAASGQILSTGTSRAMASNRVSYTFDLRGPSLTIDTACSSSMMAVHLAVSSLRRKECTLAFAGGTQLHLNPISFKGLTKMSMISPDGRSKMFDESADGYGRGEGAGVVCLKLLDDAIRDGDGIECIIRETGTNQDGRTKGITMPSAKAQSELIRKTYLSAGLDPTKVESRPQFFEAHGTGTPVGDPLEAQAIEAAFFPDEGEYADDEILHLGSVKTVIGHLEGAAGIAGLIRASLAVQYGVIPPNLHFNRLNPKVAPHTKHLRLVTAAIPWPALPNRCSRRASINSFGFGGSNTHVIIDSYADPRNRLERAHALPIKQWPTFTPFVFSAVSEEALVSTLRAHLGYLRDHRSGTSLRDLAWTLQYKRTQFNFRYATSAIDHNGLVNKLEGAIKTLTKQPGSSTRSSQSSSVRIMGIFTGQGAQYAAMGKDLIDGSTYARERIHKLDTILASLPEPDRPQWKLIEELMLIGGKSRINEALLSQPLTTAIQILLVDLLQIAGVKLDTVVGHSSGEIGAAYAAGLISAEDAIRIAYYRGAGAKLVDGENGKPGAMMVTFLTPERAEDLCNLPEFKNRIMIAAYNSPSSVTLSGDADAIDTACKTIENEKVFARKLQVEKAYHSHHMKPCAGPYLHLLEKLETTPVVPQNDAPTWFSSVFPGRRSKAPSTIPLSYWVDNMTFPVCFSHAVSTAITEAGEPDLFIEFGPHPALEKPVRQIVGNNDAVYTGLLKRGVTAITSFCDTLGVVWMKFGKSAVDFAAYDKVHSSQPQPVLIKDLPTYPWQHSKEYWWESRLLRKHYESTSPPTELLGVEMSTGASHEMKWRQFLDPLQVQWMLEHRLNDVAVLPGAAYVAMAATAGQRICAKATITVIDIQNLRWALPISFPDGRTPIESVLTVSNIVRKRNCTMAEFWIDFCSHQRVDELMNAARGTLTVHHGGNINTSYQDIFPEVSRESLGDIDPKLFYDWASESGYGYTGPFRCISSLRRRRNFATGEIRLTSNEMLFHPAALDGLFQGCLTADSFPGDSSLPKFNVPSFVRSIKVFPETWNAISGSLTSLKFDVAATGASEYGGALYSVAGLRTAFQVDGFTTAPFRMTTPQDDVSMYAEVIWTPYNPKYVILEPPMIEDLNRQRNLAIACERVALFYLKRLNEAVSSGLDCTGADQAIKHLIDFARLTLIEVRLGIQPSPISKYWLDDTKADIAAIVEEYPKSIDIRLLDAIGKAYPLIICGQTTALGTLLQDGGLNELYAEGIGFPEMIIQLGRFFKALSRRSPNMRILEVGAGTGSVTGAIMDSASFSSYMFTDVSPGFLGPAQEKFKRFVDKMSFKVFDMDKDPLEQGYEASSFDVIVAANVLHASADVEGVLARIRLLLRAGGYLVCMELSDNKHLKNTVIMGGLSGWWLRHGGQSRSPALTDQEWNDCLRRTGYTGIDAITPIPEDLLSPYRVFCSRAIDERVQALRKPLSLGPRKSDHSLMIIDGDPFRNLSLVETVTDLLLPSFQSITVLARLEDVEEGTKIPYAVLSLVELKNPLFQHMTARKWLALQKLFGEATDVLWLTAVEKSPQTANAAYANMMIGLARSVRHELRSLRLRLIDVDDPGSVTGYFLAKTMLRWYMRGQWDQGSESESQALNEEFEIAIRNGVGLVPSIVRQRRQNNRYNSQHRRITQKVDSRTHSVGLRYKAASRKYVLQELPRAPSMDESMLIVNMLYSTLFSIKVNDLGFFYLGIGTLKNGSHAVVLAESISSIVQVPRNAVLSYTSSSCRPETKFLHGLAASIVADRAVASAHAGGDLLVLTSDPILMTLLQVRAAQSKKTIVFITSDPEFERKRTVYIDPHSLDVAVRQHIPSSTTVIFNLSNREQDKTLFRRVSGMYCDNLMKIKNTHALFWKRSTGYGHLLDALSSTKEASGNTEASILPSLVTDPANTHTMKPRDVAQNSVISQPLFTIVDWTSTDELPVQIQPAAQIVSFEPTKTYLIIGSSDIAQSICEWLIDRGAKYIIMGSRTPADSLKPWAQSLASKGVCVDICAVDITKKLAVKAMISSAKAGENASNIRMPPVGGVFHLGLVLKDALFTKMTFEELQAATDVKAKGSMNLHEELLNEPLDFFVLTSSISYVFGNPGQSNYAAANAFMVGLAYYRRNVGLPASAVNLGRVAGIGYIARQPTDKQTGLYSEDLQKKMLYPISERDLHEIFAEAVLASPADSGISPQIITGLRDIDPALIPHLPWGRDPRFSNLISEAAPTSASKPKPQLSVRDQLGEGLTSRSATPEVSMAPAQGKVFDIIRSSLLKHLSVLLQIDDIDDKQSLLELGIDSLVALEIGSWARKETGVQVPHSMIFGGASVVDIASFVAGHLDRGTVGEKGKGKGKVGAK